MKEALLGRAAALAEKRLVPDPIIRWGIRGLCRQRLREQRELHGRTDMKQAVVGSMNAAPVAPLPEVANRQHYELGADFFERVLGRRLKYSCCYWEAGDTLERAEIRALDISSQRARLEDGQSVLELGCGWGSLTLWMAENYPSSHITAVSNSRSQRRFIESKARQLGLGNVKVITADMNDFSTEQRFDRIVSIEMFEHMRNYRLLLERIAGWLEPDGLLFVHVFCHSKYAYTFHDQGPSDWMGRHFFTAGLMPSEDLLASFQEDLRVIDRWSWGGQHYRRTAEAWLRNLDHRRQEILPILARIYGVNQAGLWLQRWRIFFLACAELFGFEGGSQWRVVHYLFGKPSRKVDQ